MTPVDPFSRILNVDALPREGKTVTIEASAAEREALAALHKLPTISTLTASFRVRRSGPHGVRVEGKVRAEFVQLCVVSLEPFPGVVDEEVDVRFAPVSGDDSPRRPSNEPETFSVADEDEPDPIVDAKIDLGALAAEFFALGLDPYPRKPGVYFNPPEEREAEHSPFSALAARRRN